MTRPKLNPLPESEQMKQRSRAAFDAIKSAGGKRLSVTLADKGEVEMLERAMKHLDTKSASETFMELLRRFDAGK